MKFLATSKIDCSYGLLARKSTRKYDASTLGEGKKMILEPGNLDLD